VKLICSLVLHQERGESQSVEWNKLDVYIERRLEDHECYHDGILREYCFQCKADQGKVRHSEFNA